MAARLFGYHGGYLRVELSTGQPRAHPGGGAAALRGAGLADVPARRVEVFISLLVASSEACPEMQPNTESIRTAIGAVADRVRTERAKQ